MTKMKSDVLTLISNQAAARDKRSNRHDMSLSRQRHKMAHPVAATPSHYTPEAERRSLYRQLVSIESVGEAARDVLMDRHLDVSKVRPFFWSLIEIYQDRFQAYPFDPFKALYSYLEMNDFPKEQLEDIISKLEQAYEEKHCKRPHSTEQHSHSTDTENAQQSLDDDIRALRDSLAYASLVDEDIV